MGHALSVLFSLSFVCHADDTCHFNGVPDGDISHIRDQLSTRIGFHIYAKLAFSKHDLKD